MTNAIAISELGFAVGYTSGSTLNVGRALANGGPNAGIFAGLCATYTAAGFASGLAGSRCDDVFEGRTSPGLLLSAVLLVVGAVAKRKFGLSLLALQLWSFSQGLQNAVTTTFSAGPIRSTHTAGGMTDSGIILGQWLRASFCGRTPPSLRKVILTFVSILSFAAGGFAGGRAYPRWGMQAAVVPAGMLAAAATVMPIVIASTSQLHLEQSKKKMER